MAEGSSFDLDALNAVDEAEMVVQVGGKDTDWIWTFAGPAHPQAEEQQNRIAREAMHQKRLQEQAQVNGRKWKAIEKTPDELRADNIQFVLDRLLRWSPVTMHGEPYPFSVENARALLADRKKGALLQQAIDFLIEDNSFMPRSATT